MGRRTARSVLATSVAMVALVIAPAGAAAVTLLTPAAGEITTSTPTFTWQLDSPFEDPIAFELTPVVPLSPSSPFPEHPDARSEVLDEFQTSHKLAPHERLIAGTWYWHVGAMDDATGGEVWSEVRSFAVPDEPIEIGKFHIAYTTCKQRFSFGFTYVDNSPDQAASFALGFRKRSGKLVATRRGSVDQANRGEFTQEFKRPKRLKPGRRYRVQLVLTDGAGQATGSPVKRVKVRRCLR